MFCGLLHHQKVVFISGRCPFCAADEALPWEERMFEFGQTTQFSAHLEDHFTMLGVSTPCPHPRCDKANKYLPAELREHLEDVHSLKHTSRDPRGRPKTEGVVTATKVRRTTISMVRSCEEDIIDPLLEEIAAALNQGLLYGEENINPDIIQDDIQLLSLKASPVSQTSVCNSSDRSLITPLWSSTSMSMTTSSCTTPVSTGTEAQSPTDYSGLATCIPFNPTLPVVEVTRDTAPGNGNIAAWTDAESDVTENLSDINLVRAGGSSGRQPTPDAQRARADSERKRTRVEMEHGRLKRRRS